MSGLGANPEEIHPMERLGKTIAQTYDRFLSVASAGVCFGEPMQIGERTIIPAAEVMSASGFGIGYGQGNQNGEGDDEEEPGGEGEGGGGGGGGFTRSRAVAVISISETEITVEPVVDATQIAMAGIAATAFVGYWLLRLMKNAESASGKGPSLGAFRRLLK